MTIDPKLAAHQAIIYRRAAAPKPTEVSDEELPTSVTNPFNLWRNGSGTPEQTKIDQTLASLTKYFQELHRQGTIDGNTFNRIATATKPDGHTAQDILDPKFSAKPEYRTNLMLLMTAYIKRVAVHIQKGGEYKERALYSHG